MLIGYIAMPALTAYKGEKKKQTLILLKIKMDIVYLKYSIFSFSLQAAVL